MAHCLVDKLFTQDVFMQSTMHRMKDFTPLDVNVIAEIKGVMQLKKEKEHLGNGFLA